MKKIHYIVLLAAVLAFSACGGKGEKAGAAADSVRTAQEKGPRPAEDELTRCDTARLGGHAYAISIHRYADRSLPTVTDQLDQEFYDNAVEVKIRRDGEDFFSKTFRKEAFLNFLSDADRASCILLGMAYDEESSSAGHICLAAQVGQPGTGEGPAFTIDIPAGGGSCSILRDTRQDTTRDELDGSGV